MEAEHRRRVEHMRRRAPQPRLEREERDRARRILGSRIGPVEHRPAVLPVEREVLIGLDSDQQVQGDPAGSQEQRATENRSEPEALLALPGDEHANERDRHAPDEPDRGSRVLERRGRVTPRLDRRLGRERAADDAEKREVGMLLRQRSSGARRTQPERSGTEAVSASVDTRRSLPSWLGGDGRSAAGVSR